MTPAKASAAQPGSEHAAGHTLTGLDLMRQRGYAVIPAEDLGPLHLIRDCTAREAAKLLGAEPGEPSDFLNRFHERGLKGAELNEFRVNLIRRLSDEAQAGERIWQAFRQTLLGLVGPDVLVQKATNLVIQQPQTREGTPVHRDAPPNSAFEVVVWLPLVDCYGTKGMHILDIKDTERSVDLQLANVKSQKVMEDYVWSHGEVPTVPFGSGLFFWTGLIHAVPVNGEGETRWSLNIRYKNLFSPFGTKAMPEHFRILELSPLTQAAMDCKRHQVLSSAFGTIGRG